MKALCIIALVLLALALLPVGAAARYDAGGPWVALCLGPVKLPLYPLKRRRSKPKKAEKKPKKPSKKQKKQQEAAPKPSGGLLSGGSVQDFLPLVRLGLDFAGSFFRRLRVDELTLHVRFGGADDPAKAAVNYGRAWALIGSVLPPLRQALNIRRENVSASCDFTQDRMEVYAQLQARIALGAAVAITLRCGGLALRQILLLRKKRNTNSNHSEKAVQANESSSS